MVMGKYFLNVNNYPMAKRFTATEKWQDEWFSALKPIDKLVFVFITDNCDNAGFFEINARLSSYIIGISQEEYLTSIKALTKGFVWSRCGKKIFLLKFLFHQKNLPLNKDNNAHKQILSLIEFNKENFEYDFTNLGANQGLTSPIGKGIGIVDVLEENENFKKEVFEKMRTKLDPAKFSDNYVISQVNKFSEKYQSQNINKIGNLISTWAGNMMPDILPSKPITNSSFV